MIEHGRGGQPGQGVGLYDYDLAGLSMHKRIYPPIASHSECISDAGYSFFRHVHGLGADPAERWRRRRRDVDTGAAHEFLFQRKDAAACNGDARIHGCHGAFLPQHSDGHLDPAGVSFPAPKEAGRARGITAYVIDPDVIGLDVLLEQQARLPLGRQLDDLTGRQQGERTPLQPRCAAVDQAQVLRKILWPAQRHHAR